MKVLIIGGNGNISWHCTNATLKNGHEVYVLNRGITVLTRKAIAKDVKQLTVDIADASAVEKVLDDQKFDAVVDFLCYKPVDAIRDIRLFRERTQHFIFISSAANYERKGFSEPITEERRLVSDLWEYSKNKILCEKLFMEAFNKLKFPVTIIRPGHTYDTLVPEAAGNGDWTIARRIIEHKPILLHGNGHSLWTLTHSADFASAFIGVLGKKESLGESYHITSDEVLTWEEITRIVASALGNSQPDIVHISPEDLMREDFNLGVGIVAHKMWDDVYDNTKVKRLVPGWQAKIDFQTGIQQTISWLLEKKARQRVNQRLDGLVERICQNYKE